MRRRVRVRHRLARRRVQDRGLDEEDIEKAPEDFVSILSLSQLLGCLSWHFKRETWTPGSINDSISSGAMYRYAASYLEDLGKTHGVAGAPTCPC
ncbi:MAG: hypothetical protein ACOX12_09060 [Eggerthellaceae bacterium]